MIDYDHLGNPIFDEQDLIEIMYQGDIEKCHDVICKSNPEIKSFNQISSKKLKEFKPIKVKKETFDNSLQNFWLMPDYYKNLDIFSFLKNSCKTQNELDRVEFEYNQFKEQGLENLLRYMVYLVNTMKENGIIWGVGRGSSVSSFILYLIGIHKVNSLKYNLDFNEFIK